MKNNQSSIFKLGSLTLAISSILGSSLLSTAAIAQQSEDEVIEEVVSFPNGDNDDYCDSMTLALMRFRRGGFISLHGEDTQDDEWRPRKREYY